MEVGGVKHIYFTMLTILYIHGFASSGHSGTPQMLRQMLYPQGVRVLSPDVPVMPAEAFPFLQNLVAQEHPDLIIGTSMGGFYAEQLRGVPRILVNPSFQTSRLLTFRGIGRREFLNKREDGAKDFKVDKTMIEQFKVIEKEAFKGITAADKAMVWGCFGDKDESVNHQKDFLKHYHRNHFILFEGGHQLNDKVLNHSILPVIKSVLGLS